MSGLACFAMGIGALLHIIGLAVPSWSVNNFDSSIAIGLWEQCYPQCQTYDSATVRSIRALIMLAMFCGLFGLALFGCRLLCDCDANCQCCVCFDVGGRKGLYLAMAASFTNMLFTIIGIIIWSASIHDSLHLDKGDWHIGSGYGLCLAGGLLTCFGGLVALLTGLRRLPDYSSVDDSRRHHISRTPSRSDQGPNDRYGEREHFVSTQGRNNQYTQRDHPPREQRPGGQRRQRNYSPNHQGHDHQRQRASSSNNRGHEGHRRQEASSGLLSNDTRSDTPPPAYQSLNNRFNAPPSEGRLSPNAPPPSYQSYSPPPSYRS